MPLANLHELHGAVCELAGFAPGHANRSGGPVSFSVRLGGIVVTMMDAAPGAVLFILELGTMPDASPGPGWLALLDANAFMMDVDAPRFSRNPANGDVVLHRICRLDAISATDAYELIMRMVALGNAWRADHTLSGDHGSLGRWDAPYRASHLPGDPQVVEAVAQFRGLHEGVCALLGQPVTAGGAGAGMDGMFELRLGAAPLPVTVAHAASMRPGVAFVGIRFGAPAEDSVVERSTQLMDANFALMMDTAATTFCRDAVGGEYLLMYAHRLAGTNARAFLTRAATAVAVAAAVRDTAA